MATTLPIPDTTDTYNKEVAGIKSIVHGQIALVPFPKDKASG